MRLKCNFLWIWSISHLNIWHSFLNHPIGSSLFEQHPKWPGNSECLLLLSFGVFFYSPNFFPLHPETDTRGYTREDGVASSASISLASSRSGSKRKGYFFARNQKMQLSKKHDCFKCFFRKVIYNSFTHEEMLRT